MKTTVGEKGQITIPKPLRDSLGLEAGTELECEEQDGKLVARKAASRDPLLALIGLIERLDVDSAVAGLRGPAWDPKIDGRRR